MDLIEKETAPAEDDGVDDIDLNDPEVEAAAITIQAGYKVFDAPTIVGLLSHSLLIIKPTN